MLLLWSKSSIAAVVDTLLSLGIHFFSYSMQSYLIPLHHFPYKVSVCNLYDNLLLLAQTCIMHNALYLMFKKKKRSHHQQHSVSCFCECRDSRLALKVKMSKWSSSQLILMFQEFLMASMQIMFYILHPY